MASSSIFCKIHELEQRINQLNLIECRPQKLTEKIRLLRDDVKALANYVDRR
jgi:hypothetical protein